MKKWVAYSNSTSLNQDTLIQELPKNSPTRSNTNIAIPSPFPALGSPNSSEEDTTGASAGTAPGTAFSTSTGGGSSLCNYYTSRLDSFLGGCSLSHDWLILVVRYIICTRGADGWRSIYLLFIFVSFSKSTFGMIMIKTKTNSKKYPRYIANQPHLFYLSPE